MLPQESSCGSIVGHMLMGNRVRIDCHLTLIEIAKGNGKASKKNWFDPCEGAVP